MPSTATPLPPVQPEFGHWLAGLIDGEGSFAVNSWTPRGRTGLNFRVAMVVGLRADDYAVLEYCRDQTGLGRLQFVRQGPRWSWSVDTRPDTQALVQVLDIYPLRSKKARDYALWRQVVLDRATWCHGHRNDHTLLLRLSQELKTGRTYDPSYEPNAAYAANQKGQALNVAA